MGLWLSTRGVIVDKAVSKQLKQLKDEAVSYNKLELYSKAEKSIKKAIELTPDSQNLHHELAKIYLKSKRFQDSLEILDNISLKEKYTHILLKDKSIAYFGLGKLKKALYYSEEALSKKQDYVGALVSKGNTLREMGKYNEALSVFDEAIQKSPQHRDALYQKGKVLHSLGKYREALDNFDAVLNFRPEDNAVLKAKGLSHDELEEYAEASESLKKSLSVDNSILFNDRGVALTRLGYNHKAIDSYRRALASNPKYAICWFNLGKALFRVGDLNEALKAFKKSTELNPKNRSAWNNRGVTLRQLNRLEESLDCYDRAIKLKEDYSWAWHNKGYVLELLDRPREALECYDMSIKKKPAAHEHGGDEWEKLKKDTKEAISRINKIIGD